MMFTNKNAMTCVNELVSAMENASQMMIQSGETIKDAVVLTEAFTMASLSKNCNHTAAATRGAISYERTPESSSAVVTHIECMNMPMTASVYGNRLTRKNQVTSAIVCAIESLVEFADRIRSTGAISSIIIITDVLSVTHAAVLALLFRTFSLHNGWNEDVRMILLVRQETMTAMSVYAGSMTGVDLIPCNSLNMQTYRVLNEIETANATVYTHSIKIATMCMTAFKARPPVVNLVTNVDTIEREVGVKRFIELVDGVTEVVACSNPDEFTVRITPAIRGMHTSELKTGITGTHMSYISRIRWFDNMIRHMSFNGKCYDCTLCIEVARSIMRMVASKSPIELDELDPNPIRSFRAHVGTDGIADPFET